jgi:hypothetical protein
VSGAPRRPPRLGADKTGHGRVGRLTVIDLNKDFDLIAEVTGQPTGRHAGGMTRPAKRSPNGMSSADKHLTATAQAIPDRMAVGGSAIGRARTTRRR